MIGQVLKAGGKLLKGAAKFTFKSPATAALVAGTAGLAIGSSSNYGMMGMGRMGMGMHPGMMMGNPAMAMMGGYGGMGYV